MKICVYILVQVEGGEPWSIASEILKVKGVKTAHIVTGQYDIIAYAELEDLDTLKETIKRVHEIKDVRHTQTAVCMP